MRTSTKANGMKESVMVMVYLQREMEITSRDTGSMTLERDRAHISITIKISFSLESG
jgi:hypothetical protein